MNADPSICAKPCAQRTRSIRATSYIPSAASRSQFLTMNQVRNFALYASLHSGDVKDDQLACMALVDDRICASNTNRPCTNDGNLAVRRAPMRLH